MRTLLTCVLCAGAIAVAACGSDEGIIVSASTDPETVTTSLHELRFLIGVEDANGVYVKDSEQQPDVVVDVTGRSLDDDPYGLLLRDGGDNPPSTVMVAVIGSRDGMPAAFGGFDQPQTFLPDKIIRRDVVLVGDAGFDMTDTGCVSWDDFEIVDPNDMDCDGDPSATDCDDNDPARSSMFPEICGNGIDDDCDDEIDEECEGECITAEQCEVANGAPPCGVWQCNDNQCDVVCEGCTDGDLDGYGIGDGCAGPDCDDDDDTFFDSGQRACYSGPDGTSDIGTCQPGLQTCVDGVLGPCTGEVTPSGEACNGQDDDCDGSTDEDLGTFTCGLGECVTSVAACTGGTVGVCVAPTGAVSDSLCDGKDSDCDGAIDEDCTICARVTTPGNGGNDTAAMTDGNVTPFATIQAAIDWAAGDPAPPRIVCVAPGFSCGATATFNGEVVMKDGISVYGNYRSSDFQRCGGTTATAIATGTAEGVVFDSTISSTTVLDGVRIVRATAPTTTGITVDGATNVIISDVRIEPIGTTVTNSYGVLLVNDAEALITGSVIHAGNTTGEGAGVKSVQSKPTVRDNCASLDANGRCDDSCFSAGAPGIRPQGWPIGIGESYGVLLEDSPDAVVETTAFCGGAVDTTAAVRITGKATNVLVRGNNVQTFGGVVQAYGIWADNCDGDAPWIVDNHNILAAGEVATSLVAGVKAIGDCHPVIDSNVQITGGAEGGTVGANGVHCASDGTTASRCVVLGNQLVQGSEFGYPPTAVGIRCDDGSCMRIADNFILGNTGQQSYGIWLERSGAFIDNNQIVGGCPNTKSATGVFAIDSWARLQNNRISGGGCEGTSGMDFVGLHVVAQTPGVELDVHSNTIDADGFPTGCRGVGIALDIVPGSTAGPLGVYRNNIVLGGDCTTSLNVEEKQHPADPRIFENNNLDPFNTPNALYMDEATMTLNGTAAVNALTDGSFAGNISVASQFVSYPGNLHLTSGSMCIGAGTSVGVPATDMDGEARDPSTPDIGADEFVP